MRTVFGPNKSNVPLPPAPLVSAAVVTHFRADHPYHAQRMEVVRLCLDTMLEGLRGVHFELLVWDNGSTPEFRAMLREYKPDVLVESVNVGAHNARRNLAEIARGEILCMTDDDVFFHPEFLSLQLEVLTTFPKTAIVSGTPSRAVSRWGRNTLEIPAGVKLARGNLMPEQWARDYAQSVGENIVDAIWRTRDLQDELLEYNGVKAWNHGHHLQFVGKRDIVTPFLFRSKFYLDHGRKFNEQIADAGYFQLTTFRRTALHIGNVVDDRIREIVAEWKGKK